MYKHGRKRHILGLFGNDRTRHIKMRRIVEITDFGRPFYVARSSSSLGHLIQSCSVSPSTWFECSPFVSVHVMKKWHKPNNMFTFSVFPFSLVQYAASERRRHRKPFFGKRIYFFALKNGKFMLKRLFPWERNGAETKKKQNSSTKMCVSPSSCHLSISPSRKVFFLCQIRHPWRLVSDCRTQQQQQQAFAFVCRHRYLVSQWVYSQSEMNKKRRQHHPNVTLQKYTSYGTSERAPAEKLWRDKNLLFFRGWFTVETRLPRDISDISARLSH